MIDSILRILGAGLSIWESKEKTKYIDQMIKLKKDYFDESNKERPDMGELVRIRYDIELLGIAFANKVEGSNTVHK